MQAKTERIVILVVALALLITNSVMLAVIVFQHQDATPSGRNTAQASFCINTPPVINFTCNTTMVQDVNYTCTINWTDAQGDLVTFIQAAYQTGFFSIMPNGTFNATPTNNEVGNHTYLFTATDDSTCSNDEDTELVTFEVINVNDAPILFREIPDQEFNANASVVFFLTDYFRDPDDDPMTFTSSIPSNVTITITGSQVTLFSAMCTEIYVTFTATDPYNLSADSNVVKIKVECQEDQSDGGSDEQGGGGGSGGGASSSCMSKWECDEWLSCLPNGMQWRRCFDLRGCEQEVYFKRACPFQGPPPACIENWLCTEWGNCRMNSSQERTCNDLATCGTTVLLPPTSQECIYLPSCDDDVKNGDETGVDCGGSCAACPLTEQPGLIIGDAGLSWWLILMIILGILLVSGTMHYYRGQIAQLLARLGFLVRHQAYKDVLLDAVQRKSYFERLLAFENLLGTPAGQAMADAAVYQELSALSRQYVSDALGVHQEFLPEEVQARCTELGLRKETTELLMGLTKKLAVLEQEELVRDEWFVLASIEELRTMVCVTSEYRNEELLRPVEELVIREDVSFYDEMFMRVINGLRAAQYGDFDAARQAYVAALAKYDALALEERDMIYPELFWVFEAVKFDAEIVGTRIIKKPAMA